MMKEAIPGMCDKVSLTYAITDIALHDIYIHVNIYHRHHSILLQGRTCGPITEQPSQKSTSCQQLQCWLQLQSSTSLQTTFFPKEILNSLTQQNGDQQDWPRAYLAQCEAALPGNTASRSHHWVEHFDIFCPILLLLSPFTDVDS
jgi:hypothetical protein